MIPAATITDQGQTLDLHGQSMVRLFDCQPVPIQDEEFAFKRDDDDEDDTILTEVPLALTRLCRLLPRRSTGDGAIHDAKSDNVVYDDDDFMVIPHTLPPNSILVHYGDGITRILPKLYRHLVRCGTIKDDNVLRRFDLVVHGHEHKHDYNGMDGDDNLMMRIFRNPKRQGADDITRRMGVGKASSLASSIFDDDAFSPLPAADAEMSRLIMNDVDARNNIGYILGKDDAKNGKYDVDDGNNDMATKTTNGDVDKRDNTTHRTTSSNMYVDDKIFDMLGSGDAATFRVDAGINQASNISANDNKLLGK